INAVMDIDYSPTGLEFATASYDTTVRIFKTDTTSYRSREVYHTSRMNRVFCVKFTDDGRFILSGSDDHNIRLWKAKSWEPLRHISKEEKAKLKYNEKLVERYKDTDAVGSVARHRHLPKKIYNIAKDYAVERQALNEK